MRVKENLLEQANKLFNLHAEQDTILLNTFLQCNRVQYQNTEFKKYFFIFSTLEALLADDTVELSVRPPLNPDSTLLDSLETLFVEFRKPSSYIYICFEGILQVKAFITKNINFEFYSNH